jgi:hypothetical protein
MAITAYILTVHVVLLSGASFFEQYHVWSESECMRTLVQIEADLTERAGTMQSFTLNCAPVRESVVP